MMQPWLQPMLGSTTSASASVPDVPVLPVPADVLGDHIYVYDETAGVPLFGRASTEQANLASIIKLVNAMVVVDEKSGVLDSETVTYIAADDDTPGFFSYPDHQDGDVMTLRDAVTAMVMASGNNTAKMLSRHIGTAILGGSPTVAEARAAFVSAMQDKATDAGFPDITINDEAGDATGTAQTVRAIFAEMLDSYPDLVDAADNETFDLTITGANARTDTVEHTFPLFATTGFGASKTGYGVDYRNVGTVWTAANGNKITLSILESDEGDPENDPNTRFQDALRLIMHIKDQYPASGYGTTYTENETDPGSHRRWRILIHGPGNGALFIGFAELKFLEDGNLGTATQSGTVSVSEERTGFEGVNLFDGDPSTYWSPPEAPSYPAWVELDMGTPTPVHGVSMKARDDFAANQLSGNFDVQYHDGSDWVSAWSVREDTVAEEGELRIYRAPYAADVPAVDPHRYWRVISDKNYSATFVSIAQIEFASETGGTDITDTYYAIAGSDRGSGFEPENAFDNDDSSFWSALKSAGDANMWIGQDFGSPVDVAEVRMTARDTFSLGYSNAMHMPAEWRLQYSDDGSTWTTKWTYLLDRPWMLGEQRTYTEGADVRPSGGFQYWRIGVTNGNVETYVSIAEIEMATTSGGSNDCTTGQTIYGIQRSGFEATKAFDGIVSGNNAWGVIRSEANDVDVCWAGQNFGSDYDLYEVRLSARADAFNTHAPTSFVVECSDDGTDWQVAWAETDIASWSAGQERTYVRP